jgi:hypothetical protein
MSHLILLRHGESQLNVVNRQKRVYCGQYETPLTKPAASRRVPPGGNWLAAKGCKSNGPSARATNARARPSAWPSSSFPTPSKPCRRLPG